MCLLRAVSVSCLQHIGDPGPDPCSSALFGASGPGFPSSPVPRLSGPILRTPRSVLCCLVRLTFLPPLFFHPFLLLFRPSLSFLPMSEIPPSPWRQLAEVPSLPPALMLLLLQKQFGAGLSPLSTRPELSKIAAFLSRRHPSSLHRLVTTLTTLSRLAVTLKTLSASTLALVPPPHPSQGSLSSPQASASSSAAAAQASASSAASSSQASALASSQDVLPPPRSVARRSRAQAFPAHGDSPPRVISDPEVAQVPLSVVHSIQKISSALALTSSILQEEVLGLLVATKTEEILTKVQAAVFEITQANYVSLDTSTAPPTAYIASQFLHLITKWIAPVQRQILVADSQGVRPSPEDLWSPEFEFPADLETLPAWARLLHQGWAHSALRELHPMSAMEGIDSSAAVVMASLPAQTFDLTQLWLQEEAFYRRVAKSLLPLIAKEIPADSPAARNWRTFTTKSDHGWKLTGPAAPPASAPRKPQVAVVAASSAACPASSLIDKALSRLPAPSSSPWSQPAPPASHASQPSQATAAAPAKAKADKQPKPQPKQKADSAPAAPSPVVHPQPRAQPSVLPTSRKCEASGCAVVFIVDESRAKHKFCSLECRKATSPVPPPRA